jgi:hypothetical protein
MDFSKSSGRSKERIERPKSRSSSRSSTGSVEKVTVLTSKVSLKTIEESTFSTASSSKSRASHSQVKLKKIEKKTAVMSMWGTPPKLDAKAGEVFRVSPKPKKALELQNHQVGIVKTFSQSVKIPLPLDNKDVVTDFLVASMEKRWDEEEKTWDEEKKIMQGEIYNLKEELSAKFDSKFDDVHAKFDDIHGKFDGKFDGIYAKFDSMEQILGLQALEKGTIVRRVVTEWEESNNGKAILGAIAKVVKKKYAQEKISNRIFTNILTEVKDLIRMEDLTKSSPILEVIKIAILEMDKEDKLGLQEVKKASTGLIEIMDAFLGANKKVHQALLENELKEISIKASDHYYGLKDGDKWLAYFANNLMSKYT